MAKAENQYHFQIIALINKAYAYSFSKFFSQSVKTLDEAIEISTKLNGDQYYNALGDIYQCRAEIENSRNDTAQNLLYNRKSIHYYKLINNRKRKETALASQYFNLAFSYLDIGKKTLQYIVTDKLFIFPTSQTIQQIRLQHFTAWQAHTLR